MIDEKPFSDVRRARFERGGKRAWLGKSVRRVDRYEATSHADKTAEVKPSNEWSQGCVGDGEPENRRLVSALECTLDDMPCTLDKDGAWEWLPALLAEHAIQPPSLVKSKVRGASTRSSRLSTAVYTLEAVAEQVEVRREGCPSRAEARQAAARRCQPRGGAIYRMRNKRTPAPFATPPSEAPEGVQGALLTPKRVGGRGGRHASAAVVRANRVEAAWDVERAGGVGTKNAFIEIDLGQNCDLTEVSTQGRHPPTRTFPQIRHERRAARRALGGGRPARAAFGDDDAVGYAVEGRPWWSLSRDGPYEGPFWEVLAIGEGSLAGSPWAASGYAVSPPPRHYTDLQWVTRYEVSVREAGGRAWRSLGVHRGNDDATSEVVHSLSQFKGGVRARFVRFRPLEAVGGGAMRVGVYGRAARAGDGLGDAPSTAARIGSGGGRGNGGGGDAEGAQLINYELGLPCTRTEGRAYAPKSGNKCGCACCLRYPPRPSRTSRKAELRSAVNGPRCEECE